MSNVTDFPKRPPRGRSAVTNGKRLLVEGDHTGKWGRRFRDIINDYTDHLGGRAEAGTARLAIVRRVAAIEIALESMDAVASVEPEKFDVDRYQRAANTHRRLVETLGLDPKQKDVAPSLAQYLARKGGAA